MPSSYGYQPSMIDLILNRGRIAAEGAQQSGDIWGRTVSGLGQLATDTIQHVAQANQVAKRDRSWLAYVNSGEWAKDPQKAYVATQNIWGPDEAPKHFQGIMGVAQLMNKERNPEADGKAAGALIRSADSMTPAGRAAAYPQLAKLVKGAYPDLPIDPQYSEEKWADIRALAPALLGEKPAEPIKLAKDEKLLKPGTYETLADNPAPIKPEKAPEVGSFEDQVIRTYGQNPTSAQITKARQDWAMAGRDPNAAAAAAATRDASAAARDSAREDRSFQYNSTQLESKAKPLIDQAERFSRLVETVNQKTPQADALIAPELLTVMAGGQGSGLRMNEAEISRLIGGRSNLEGLKAALNKWSLNPNQALSVTDAQRDQIRKLIGGMRERIQGKVDMFNEARQKLATSKSVDEHRNILANLSSELTKIGGSAEPIIQKNDETGEYRYSTDGGKTWISGKP